MTNLKTEVSHTELIHVLSPLLDVSATLDILVEKAGSGNAGETLGSMDANVKQAVESLTECIEKIEKENPSAFGLLDG